MEPPVLEPEAVASVIFAIRALDLENVTIEDIAELLTPACIGYAVRTPNFPPGKRSFRSRICDKPANIRALLYPPPGIAGLGRVNRAGGSVFYCSTLRDAPFFESRPKEGQTVATGLWVTTAPLLVNNVGYWERVFTALGSSRANPLEDDQTHVSGGDVNRLVSEFFAEAFTRVVEKGSEPLYKVSVAIAEWLFDAELFDGLMYPAIAMRANADNFALKPRYVDNHLQFLNAEYARIDTVREFGFDITVLDTANKLAPDGTILWRGRIYDRWMIGPEEELTCVVESGEWVVRDKSGRILAPE